MTVREALAELSTMDPDRILVVQADSKGNTYRPLAGMDDNAGCTRTPFGTVRVGHQRLSNEDRDNGFSDDDLCDPGALPCVVLYQ